MQADIQPAMTVKEVAALLNVDDKTIYRLVTKGEIPCFKVLGSWRFQRHDLAEWIELKKSETKLFTKVSKDTI
jgi:excisionase family DNA binding protein